MRAARRVPLYGRPLRPAVISSRLPPVVVRGIQLHFTALAHSCVPTVWGLFIATTPSCYCSGKGGREIVGARVAGGLAVGEAGGDEKTQNRGGFELRGAWGSSGLALPHFPH